MLTCCNSQRSREERRTLRPLGNSTHRRTNDPRLSSTYLQPTGNCAGKRSDELIVLSPRIYWCLRGGPCTLKCNDMIQPYPRYSLRRASMLSRGFCAQSLRGARSKYFSDLSCRLAANVITPTFKFGDGLAPKFFQCFLARSVIHRTPQESIILSLCGKAG